MKDCWFGCGRSLMLYIIHRKSSFFWIKPATSFHALQDQPSHIVARITLTPFAYSRDLVCGKGCLEITLTYATKINANVCLM